MANDRPPLPSRPAEYSFAGDEEPTRPDGVACPHLAVLVSVYRQECELDRRRLARMVEAWHSLPLDQRILVEQLAFELARPHRR